MVHIHQGKNQAKEYQRLLPFGTSPWQGKIWRGPQSHPSFKFLKSGRQSNKEKRYEANRNISAIERN
jgi:hypothetical protein